MGGKNDGRSRMSTRISAVIGSRVSRGQSLGRITIEDGADFVKAAARRGESSIVLEESWGYRGRGSR
jgi:hypothetical protein